MGILNLTNVSAVGRIIVFVLVYIQTFLQYLHAVARSITFFSKRPKF